MPRFNVISPSDPSTSCEVDGLNATAALDMVVRRKMQLAHVFEDGSYLFTANHSRAGLWLISKVSVQELPVCAREIEVEAIA